MIYSMTQLTGILKLIPDLEENLTNSTSVCGLRSEINKTITEDLIKKGAEDIMTHPSEGFHICRICVQKLGENHTWLFSYTVLLRNNTSLLPPMKNV